MKVNLALLVVLFALGGCNAVKPSVLTIEEQHAWLLDHIEQHERNDEWVQSTMKWLREFSNGPRDGVNSADYFAVLQHVDEHRSGDFMARLEFAEQFMQLRPEERARFHLTTLDLHEAAVTNCNVDVMARLDAQAGHFNILRSGMPSHEHEILDLMDDYLFMKYRIRRFFTQSCTGAPQYFDLVATYNEAMVADLEKTYGKSYNDMVSEAHHYAEWRYGKAKLANEPG